MAEKQLQYAKLCLQAKIDSKIGFIGGGNMAQAMIKGFIQSGKLVNY